MKSHKIELTGGCTVAEALQVAGKLVEKAREAFPHIGNVVNVRTAGSDQFRLVTITFSPYYATRSDLFRVLTTLLPGHEPKWWSKQSTSRLWEMYRDEVLLVNMDELKEREPDKMLVLNPL